MPYPTLDSLPDGVKTMPSHAQNIWQSAFNSAYEQCDGDEKMKKMMQKMMGDMMQNIMSGMMLVPKDGSKSKMKSIIDLHGIRLIDTTEIDIKGLTEGAPIQIMCVGEWSHPEYGDFSI